mgnify:CR=1 FL=1
MSEKEKTTLSDCNILYSPKTGKYLFRSRQEETYYVLAIEEIIYAIDDMFGNIYLLTKPNEEELLISATMDEVNNSIPGDVFAYISRLMILNMGLVERIEHHTFYIENRPYSVTQKYQDDFFATLTPATKTQMLASEEPLKTMLSMTDRVYVYTSKGNYTRILLDELIRISSDGNSCNLYIKSGKKPVSSFVPMKAWLTKLPEDTFVRISRTEIINLNFVHDISTDRVGLGNEELAVSRRRQRNLWKGRLQVIKANEVYKTQI